MNNKKRSKRNKIKPYKQRKPNNTLKPYINTDVVVVEINKDVKDGKKTQSNLILVSGTLRN